jgi:integrase
MRRILLLRPSRRPFGELEADGGEDAVAVAADRAREGVPLIVIQRQLGHTNLGITSIYLQGIDNAEIIDTVHARRAPMVPVHSSLRV